MRQWITSLLFVTAALGAPRAALAHYTGYVCEVMLEPASGSLGASGDLEVALYSLPGCGGSWIRTVRLCSAGATSASCGRQFKESQLNSLFEAAQRAAYAGQRVTVSTSGTGASEKIFTIFFRAD